jgi:predicted RNA-binding protein with RPS1 domain
MDELIKQILKFGLLPTFLLIVIFLIIQEPERATKIRALVTEPFYKLFKWFSKEYISSKVSSQANEFLNSSIFSKLAHAERFLIKVKWVSKPNDPILSENGTLILRLKEENDQTKNILSAVHSALPHVLCPLFRTNINSTCEKSIDLTILRKLSEQLGKHGKITFKRYFLDPETDNDIEINELIKKLIVLDKHGFFVPIFINELELLGEGLYADNDKSDYSNQVLQFIEYLLTIVNREVGKEIELEYLLTPFKVSTILLARAQRADRQGLRPYLRRLKINLDKGSESIYIIAFPPAFEFFERLIKPIESHERVFIKKVLKTNYSLNYNGHQSNLKIAVLTRNDIFADQEFEQKIIANNLHEGSRVKGIVEDISQQETLVTIMGMRAYISKNECSWRSIANCSEILKVGNEYKFQIKRIDKSINQIHLTLKLQEDNPWELVEIPKIGQIVNLELLSYDSIKFTCLYQDKLEVYIPIDEISWFFLTHNQYHDYLGSVKGAKVIIIDEQNEKIYCSLRQTDENPWINIHASLPIGKTFNGKVTDVTFDYIQVRLPNNYFGQIPKEYLEKAGFEYANFQENVVIGQGIEVIISKVFIAKKRIRLDLKRNKK